MFEIWTRFYDWLNVTNKITNKVTNKVRKYQTYVSSIT